MDIYNNCSKCCSVIKVRRFNVRGYVMDSFELLGKAAYKNDDGLAQEFDKFIEEEAS